MAKKKKKQASASIKLQISAGSANPAPPVGPALGQHGLNIMQFCKQFNDKTKDKDGMVLPVVITVYSDRSFDFIIKSPPASVLLKRAANLAKAASNPGKETMGMVSLKQVEEIAKQKIQDLNTGEIKEAVKVIAGTARSMGLKIE